MGPGRRLFHLVTLAATNAAGKILIGAGGRCQAAHSISLISRLLPHHWVFDIVADLLEGLRLVMMRIDVDDEEILIAPPPRLLLGMRQQRPRIDFLERQIANRDRIHVLSSPEFRLSRASHTSMNTPPFFSTTLIFCSRSFGSQALTPLSR